MKRIGCVEPQPQVHFYQFFKKNPHVSSRMEKEGIIIEGKIFDAIILVPVQDFIKDMVRITL